MSLFVKASQVGGNKRWLICSMLFTAIVINYLDRQILGILAPLIQKEIGWSQVEYSEIVMAFIAAYGIGMLAWGRIGDRLGAKLAYGAAMVFWSAAAGMHAFVGSVLGFAIARALLGFGEGSCFPVATKAVSEWFPAQERATAMGICVAGTSIGGVLAPAILPWMASHLGWRISFLIVALVGFVWLVFWIYVYHKPADHPRLAAAELAYIQSDQALIAEVKVPWISLLKYRETWALIVAKFLTEPVWWFFLFWLPKWLNESRGLNITSLGMPLFAIYLLATFGSIAGGALSSRILRQTGNVNMARKITMLITALIAPVIIMVNYTPGLWPAVVLVGLVSAAHQSWSTTLMTTASDAFPKQAVGSVIGVCGVAGMTGSFLFSGVVGQTLEATGQYGLLFAFGAIAYGLSLAIYHLLVPNLRQVALTS